MCLSFVVCCFVLFLYVYLCQLMHMTMWVVARLNGTAPEITFVSCTSSGSAYTDDSHTDCSTDGTAILTIQGTDFGQQTGSIEYIHIGTANCPTVEWISHTQMKCALIEGPTDSLYQTLSISVGGQPHTSGSIFRYAGEYSVHHGSIASAYAWE